jgi:hypothetical protein
MIHAALKERRAALDDRAEGYARAHHRFLKEANPKFLRQLQESGMLEEHLREIGESAEAMYETLTTQMSNDPNLPTDFMERVKALEAIPVTVDELVMHEFILQPIPE